MALINKDKKADIHNAIQSGDTGIIKEIKKQPLAVEPPIKQPTIKTSASRVLQPRNWNLKGVQEAISQGADLDAADQNGWTALIDSSANGRTAILKLLIDSGANLNSRENQFGWTALIAAASNGHWRAVKLLIDARVDLNATDNLGWTALMHAYFYSGMPLSGYGSIIDMLEKAGADRLRKTKGYAAYELAGIAQYFRTPREFNLRADAKRS